MTDQNVPPQGPQQPYYPPPPYGAAGPAPIPPPAPAKPSRALYLGLVATAVVLLAGCCFGGRALMSKDDDGPMTAAQYASALAATDTALKAQAPALKADDHAPMVQVLRTEAEKLDELLPPENAESANRLAYGSLLALAKELEEPEKNTCKAAAPYNDLLVSTPADAVRLATKDLAAVDPSFVFGTFLPAAPKETDRRLKNGDMVKKPARRGDGVLEVQNSVGGGDTTISLVPENGKDPLFTVYLRGAGRVTVEGIRYGTYQLYTASGKDWDAAKKGFTRDCSFAKFDDKFDFDASSPGWEVKLTESAAGNASTSDVDPGAFPGN